MNINNDIVDKTIPKTPLNIYRGVLTDFVNETMNLYGKIGVCPDCQNKVKEWDVYCSECNRKLDWNNKPKMVKLEVMKDGKEN